MININELINKEGWAITGTGDTQQIIAFGQKYPLTHPVNIHLKLYRTETNPDAKYRHMKAAHDYIWPKTVWHYWTERRFKVHCGHWNYISLAGGASTAKSYDAAKIGILFWLANPKHRGVIVASTTLESIQARILGYITKLLKESAVPITYQYLGGQVPKILYPEDGRGKGKDTIHGIFSVAAKKGSDDLAINSWIGRHPDEALLVILDECTDMPLALSKAFTNLDSSSKPFQLWAIGNSNSKFDLHGALSTPKTGWNSIDPYKHTQWETTQRNGCCLYFSCYESPALVEPDPVKKTLLSKFLITKEQIEEKEKKLGKTNILFMRFVLGFWLSSNVEDTVVSAEFMNSYDITKNAEFSGLWPLVTVGGLDPAFSVGGDKCLLRLAVLGVDVTGKVVLDFRGEALKYEIKISAIGEASEMQVADQAKAILEEKRCDLRNVAFDGNGQGRALGSLVQLKMGSMWPPIKIYSVRSGSQPSNSFDVVIRDSYQLWFAIREFIEHGQIKGLDVEALQQFTTRITSRTDNGRIKLESKAEYKRRLATIDPRMAHSPDDADVVALCVQAAIIQFGFTPGQRRDVGPERSFAADKFAAYNREVALQEENHSKRPERVSATFKAPMSALLEYKRPFT